MLMPLAVHVFDYAQGFEGALTVLSKQFTLFDAHRKGLVSFARQLFPESKPMPGRCRSGAYSTNKFCTVWMALPGKSLKQKGSLWQIRVKGRLPTLLEVAHNVPRLVEVNRPHRYKRACMKCAPSGS